MKKNRFERNKEMFNFIESLKKLSTDAQVRNVMITVHAENVLNKDNPQLGVKAGETIKYSFDDIIRELEEWSHTKMLSYYAIRHDKESRVHYHIVIDFNINSQAKYSQIKKHFPLGEIRACQYGVKACVQYLVHLNDPSKFQYSWDEVRTNNPSRLESYKCLGGSSSEKWFEHYKRLILKGEIKEHQLKLINPDVYIKHCNEIKRLFEYVREVRIAEENRNIKVIVVQGPPGVGKGVYVKDWCKTHNKSVCFSSANNDPWNHYRSQDVFVYDDNSFEKETIQDVLKVLDPHNNASMESRYQNRFFFGDTIFILTNTPVLTWFSDEAPILRQALFRRIKAVVEFSEPEDTKSTISINNLVFDETKRAWRYELLREKPFDLNDYVDVDADEEETQALIDSL